MKGKVAGNNPIMVELKEGKTYAWCSCGESGNQPYCDGSHSGTDFKPKVFTANESRAAYMCTCKQTDNPGFCDGSHNNLR